jgi:DNA-binding NarL/FixJ family response regulator
MILFSERFVGGTRGVALLQQFEQRADVPQASATAEGLRLAEAHPDLEVVFLDLNIPDQNGMDVIPAFARRCPQLPVIVLKADGSGALSLASLGNQEVGLP